MWLFLWVVFVLTAAGFFLWSYHATYEQKKTWKAFANKFQLQYVAGALMQPPAMAGEIKGRQVNFYTQNIENNLGQKMSQNVVEVFLNDIPDILCVVASSGFADFVSVLDLPEPFSVDDKAWPKNLMSRTLEDEAPEIWFKENHDRINAINKISKLPFDFTFLVDGEQAFVAVRTANPLSNSTQLNKVIGLLFDIVKLLESQGGEATAKSAPPSSTHKEIIEKPYDEIVKVEPESDESKS